MPVLQSASLVLLPSRPECTETYISLPGRLTSGTSESRAKFTTPKSARFELGSEGSFLCGQNKFVQKLNITKSLQMSTRDANDDQDRGKLVCKAWDGSRSPEFSNAFVRDFSLGADAKYAICESTIDVPTLGIGIWED